MTPTAKLVLARAAESCMGADGIPDPAAVNRLLAEIVVMQARQLAALESVVSTGYIRHPQPDDRVKVTVPGGYVNMPREMLADAERGTGQ